MASSNDDLVLNRRQFLGASSAALTVGCALAGEEGGSKEAAAPKKFRGGRYEAPLAVSTWDHGLLAARAAFSILQVNGLPIDAVERSINVIEENPKVESVGLGGFPNEEGVVQLDAAIMDGLNLRCGSVQALEDIATPISVARRVFEKTRHVQLVGPGALRFALKEGFQPGELLTPSMRTKWEAWKKSSDRKIPGKVRESGDDEKDRDPNSGGEHDTVGLVVLSRGGSMAAGCSTSGLAWKMPGRVGDSPIIGAGLYCDADVGGASATGIGEEVLRVCGSFLIVEAMRRGASPQEAVEEALARIIKADPLNRKRQVAFIALSKTGEVGAASILPGFQVAIRNEKTTLLLQTHSIEG